MRTGEEAPKTGLPMNRSGDSNWGRGLGLGIEMVVAVGLGVVVGHWLDDRYGWRPVGVLVGGGLGFAAGMYLLIKQAIGLNR